MRNAVVRYHKCLPSVLYPTLLAHTEQILNILLNATKTIDYVVLKQHASKEIISFLQFENRPCNPAMITADIRPEKEWDQNGTGTRSAGKGRIQLGVGTLHQNTRTKGACNHTATGPSTVPEDSPQPTLAPPMGVPEDSPPPTPAPPTPAPPTRVPTADTRGD